MKVALKKVVFIPDTDDKYTPLVLTPNKVYDVIKVIDEIFYMITSDDGETRTYYNSFFTEVDRFRENKINEIIS
jgi:hypothetical protein